MGPLAMIILQNLIRDLIASAGPGNTIRVTCDIIILGCVPFCESKNGFLILDLPDFAVERNVKSEIGFVTLVTFRQRVQYARQPLKE